MISEQPPSGAQRRRIEARYRGTATTGWYRGDMGAIAPHLTVPVWIYATWAPFDVNLIGSSSKDYIALVDNTYVASFAHTMSKIELGSRLFPETDDYSDLTRGNFKKYLAEQQYLVARDRLSIQWVIEYLIEYNGRNRSLEQRFQATPETRDLLRAIGLLSSNCTLFHEVGHVAYGVSDYSTRIRGLVDTHTAALLGPKHSMPRLEVEIFCDLFSAVNGISLAMADGWDRQGLRNLFLFVLMSAFLCIKTRQLIETSSTGGSKVSLSPDDDILMARFAIVDRAIDELLATGPVSEPTKVLPFPDTAGTLAARWHAATAMDVREAETETIATILSEAFADPERGGFDHVMATFNQLSPLSDLSVNLGGSSIHPFEA